MALLPRYFLPLLSFLLVMCALPGATVEAQTEDPHVEQIGSNQNWRPLFRIPGALGSLERDYAEIQSVVEYKGELVAIGSFGFLDGVPCENIATWTGVTWRAWDTPPPFSPYIVTTHEDLLVIGTQYDRGESPLLYAWDGETWTSLGLTADPGDFAFLSQVLSTSDGLLVLGNWHKDNDASKQLWLFDGEAWSELPLGDLARENTIRDMVEHEGEVYFCGTKDFEGGGFVAKFEPSNHTVIATSERRIHRLLSTQNGLVVAGSFKTINGVLAKGIAIFDGQSWSGLGEGLWRSDGRNFSVSGLFEGADSEIVVVGSFSHSGETQLRSQAYFDGQAWHQFAPFTVLPYLKGVLEFENKTVFWGHMVLSGTETDHVATKEGTRYQPIHPWPRTIVSPPWRMCNFNGELVGGAVFTTTNNHTLGFAVGKLVNNEWVLLGGEFNDLVLDLVVYKGELYAAGIFSEVGAKKVPFLGRWSGEAWEPVAEFSGPVATLAVYDDKLVAGGLFDRVNGELMNNISAWNGESWENLDGGITGDALVLDVFVHQGNLIATGEFRWAGPKRIQSIAMWNGSGWAGIGNLNLWSQSSRIDRAMSWGNEIVVASSYLQEDWGELATWNGHSWKPVFPRLFGSVYLLEEYRGNLVVGGRLSVERGRRHKLLQYDHDRWSSFGREEEGVVGSADSFLPFGDGFYVAGGFRVTGSDASLILGHWDGKDQTFSPVPVTMTIAPNPASSRAIVSWSDAPVGVGTLTVYDIRGRRVRTLYENDTTQTKGASIWDLRDDNDVRVASGVYFMKLESRAGSVSKKIVVTR